MRRRDVILGLAAGLGVLAAPAAADDMTSQIVRQLRKQGYKTIRISRTFLGRTRIMAFSANATREIVVNPRTGEILRDFASGGPVSERLFDPNDDDNHQSGNGSGDDGDDDNQDDSGDDDGDDNGNSGPGSDDSGHGSEDSGHGSDDSGGPGGNSGSGGGDDD